MTECRKQKIEIAKPDIEAVYSADRKNKTVNKPRHIIVSKENSTKL